MGSETRKSAGFVLAHEPAVTGNIGGEDSRKPALDPLRAQRGLRSLRRYQWPECALPIQVDQQRIGKNVLFMAAIVRDGPTLSRRGKCRSKAEGFVAVQTEVAATMLGLMRSPSLCALTAGSDASLR